MHPGPDPSSSPLNNSSLFMQLNDCCLTFGRLAKRILMDLGQSIRRKLITTFHIFKRSNFQPAIRSNVDCLRTFNISKMCVPKTS